jgi:hypothetical protein
MKEDIAKTVNSFVEEFIGRDKDYGKGAVKWSKFSRLLSDY